ncbi:uncharacterized protein LOC125314664 [Rhodamnia argentea]|uniref:Uncharacterized protein LOC125314664 n=1 Tax=Rhodamnia argentea TaxID=178133 RepID=A0ABM3HA41_9MYRT|nr:uncharacterized protein LOC125314664 [Rhodamnia argentea]
MSSDSDPPLVSLVRDRGKRAIDIDPSDVPRGSRGRPSIRRQDDTRADSQETRKQSQQLRAQNNVSGVIEPGGDRGYTFAQFGKAKPPTYDGQTDPLMAFAGNFVADEKDKAEHFQRGLRPEIRFELASLLLTTYEDVLERAIGIEQEILESGIAGAPQHKRHKARNFQESHLSEGNKQRGFSGIEKAKSRAILKPSTTCGKLHSGQCYWKTGVCFLCGKAGYIRQTCPMQRKAPADNRSCFVCGRPGHLARTCPMRKNAPPVDRPQENQQRQRTAGKVFTMTEEDAAASNAVVTGDVSIASRYAYALFGPGATHSFVSMKFAKKLDVPPKSLDGDLRVDTPTGDFFNADRVYKRWLISVLQARKLLKKGCHGYLAYVRDTNKDVVKLENVSVVRDFPDVFPEDLPDLPLDREIEFFIDPMPGTTPISKAPYRMAPTELRELKTQLQELPDKGFIRPSVSPWGAPVLFVKKKDNSMRLCIDYPAVPLLPATVRRPQLVLKVFLDL